MRDDSAMDDPNQPPVEPTRKPRGTGRRLNGAVAHKLGLAILSGEYAPGDTLSGVIAFAEELEVSRSAYREAVRLKPDLPIAHYYLAQGLKHFGHIAEAQTEMARAERLGDDTFRAALTAKVRNKAEEHKRYVAYLAQQGHGHTFPINLSPVEVRQMLAKDRADHLKIMQELEAKKAKLALKDKPQPQP